MTRTNPNAEAKKSREIALAIMIIKDKQCLNTSEQYLDIVVNEL